MPAPRKKTPKQTARIVEMFGGGYSIAHIARVEGIDRKTVRLWLEAEGIDPTAARDDAAKGPAPAKRERGLEEQAVLTVEALRLEQRADEPESVGLLRGRLAQIRALLERAMLGVAVGAVPETLVTKLADLELKYGAKLADLELALRPPPVPDPEKDPNNPARIARIEGKLRTLVSNEDRNNRCVHCGEHPYR